MEEIRDKVTAAIIAEINGFANAVLARDIEKQLAETIRTLVGYAMFKAREAPVAKS